MDVLENIFSGEKEEMKLEISKEIVNLVRKSSKDLGISESDFVNGLLVLYYNERETTRHVLSYEENEVS